MISVHTRYKNHTLHNMMREFIPDHIPVHAHDGFNHYTCALWYLVHIIMTADTRYIVSVDEDCFIYDWEELEYIVKDMDHDGISLFGMPDSKDYHVGRDNSEKVFNPFFLIIETERARNILSKINIGDLLTKPSDCKYNEPFNYLMSTLHYYCKSLDSIAITMDDGITTDTTFAYHTWYSREYGTNPEHTTRINNIYLKAKERWKIEK